MITFEETIQTVLNLIMEKEKLLTTIKGLQEKINELNVRLSDKKEGK